MMVVYFVVIGSLGSRPGVSLYDWPSFGEVMENDPSIAVLLSEGSRALLICLSQLALDSYAWKTEDFDAVEKALAKAMDELMVNLLVGAVVPIATSEIAEGMLLCDGAQYDRVDYPLLYAALASAYIVSADVFEVPDLRGNFVVGKDGSDAVGDEGGVDAVTLTVAQIPSHKHTYYQYTYGIDMETVGIPDPTAVGQPALPQDTSTTGSGQAHDNLPPYHVLRFGIISG